MQLVQTAHEPMRVRQGPEHSSHAVEKRCDRLLPSSVVTLTEQELYWSSWSKKEDWLAPQLSKHTPGMKPLRKLAMENSVPAAHVGASAVKSQLVQHFMLAAGMMGTHRQTTTPHPAVYMMGTHRRAVTLQQAGMWHKLCPAHGLLCKHGSDDTHRTLPGLLSPAAAWLTHLPSVSRRQGPSNHRAVLGVEGPGFRC